MWALSSPREPRSRLLVELCSQSADMEELYQMSADCFNVFTASLQEAVFAKYLLESFLLRSMVICFRLEQERNYDVSHYVCNCSCCNAWPLFSSAHHVPASRWAPLGKILIRESQFLRNFSVHLRKWPSFFVFDFILSGLYQLCMQIPGTGCWLSCPPTVNNSAPTTLWSQGGCIPSDFTRLQIFRNNLRKELKFY